MRLSTLEKAKSTNIRHDFYFVVGTCFPAMATMTIAIDLIISKLDSEFDFSVIIFNNMQNK